MYPPQQNNAYGNNSYGNGFHHYQPTQHLQGYKSFPPMPNTSNGGDFNTYQLQQQLQQQHRPPSEHQQNSQPSSAGSVDDPNSHAEILDLDSHKVHQVCNNTKNNYISIYILYNIE